MRIIQVKVDMLTNMKVFIRKQLTWHSRELNKNIDGNNIDTPNISDALRFITEQITQ